MTDSRFVFKTVIYEGLPPNYPELYGEKIKTMGTLQIATHGTLEEKMTVTLLEPKKGVKYVTAQTVCVVERFHGVDMIVNAPVVLVHKEIATVVQAYLVSISRFDITGCFMSYTRFPGHNEYVDFDTSTEM